MRRPARPPAVRHQPHLPARALHPDPPDQRHHRAAAAGARHRRGLGAGGGACSPTPCRWPACAPATASRSRSRSARTCSSGPPGTGCRSSAPRRSRWAGWPRCSACRRSPRSRPRRSCARPPTRCGCSRWRSTQRLEHALEPIRQVICTGEPGRLAARGALAHRGGLRRRCFDHAGLTEVGPWGYPCPEGGGLHVYDDEFVCEILDSGPAPGRAGRARRAGADAAAAAPASRCCATAPATWWSTATERCPAGHEHRWLPGGIVGRTDDMVVIRGMNVFPSAIEEAVRGVSGVGRVPHHLLLRAGGMDEIKLEVELADGARGAPAAGGHAPAAGPARARGARRRRACCRAPRARRAGSSTSGCRGGRPRERQRRARSGAAAAPPRPPRRQRARGRADPAPHRAPRGCEPGDFLGREGDLAAELGVSRPTLREALKLLASGNLIRANKGPGGGIFVAHTAEQGMSRSLSDAIAMMLETGAVSLRRAARRAPGAGGPAGRPRRPPRRRRGRWRACGRRCDAEAAAAATRGAGRRRRRGAPDVAAAAGNRMLEALTGWIFEVLQPSLVGDAGRRDRALGGRGAARGAAGRDREGRPAARRAGDEGPPALPARRAADGRGEGRRWLRYFGSARPCAGWCTTATAWRSRASPT